MDARQQARRTMETDLRAGLAKKEFELLYQPLFDLRENRVCGFEALIRWNHPAGRVSPVMFIPVAEDTGLIVQVGEWVLTEACMEAAAWPSNVKVAVNVSPIQFRSPHLVAAVQGALARSGLPAARLELEITESVLMADSEATLAILHRLRKLGVRISMDDFGTGFSLARLPPELPLRQDQDRPVVRPRPDGAGQFRRQRPGHRPGDHRPRQQPRHADHGRGRGDGGATGPCAARGVQRGPGLPFSRPAMAGEVAGLIKTLGLRSGVAMPPA